MVFLFLIVVFCLHVNLYFAAIYDPLNVFCGPYNCYELLGIPEKADAKDIKKAFRKLSLTHHPDKNKAPNATEVFRLITKAHDVLISNDSREMFDYYLRNPRDYFTVSGEHYYRNLPKSDVRLVVVVVIGLLTWLFYSIQYQKYERVVKYLKTATLANLNLKNGGTKQTMELFRRASEKYEEKIKELKSKGDKTAGKTKMLKDPIFEKIVDEVVREVKVEGGFRKPEFHDLFAVQLVYFPYNFYQWAVKYHRRFISKAPLPFEDRFEMSRDRVGLSTWEELPEAEQDKLIEREIWKDENYKAWIDEQEAILMKKYAKKGSKFQKRRKQMEGDEDEEGEDEYIE